MNIQLEHPYIKCHLNKSLSKKNSLTSANHFLTPIGMDDIELKRSNDYGIFFHQIKQ